MYDADSRETGLRIKALIMEVAYVIEEHLSRLLEY
jgi:hypothetical protein